jgi:hypothetical protein
MPNITRHPRRRTGTVTATVGEPGTAALRVTPYRAGTARRIKVRPEVGGVLGTAVRPATRCRAATVHLIKARSAARPADTATELGRRLRAICLAK